MPNREGEHVKLGAGLSAYKDELSLIICDLWGVMHDGIHLNAGAVDAIERARGAGLRTVFLSNAPRPRTHVRALLHKMGMPEALTDYIVTSGGLARDEVRERYQGAALYHLGPESDHNTVDGLPVDLVKTPDEADIILATDLDFFDVESHRGWLAGAASRGVPFLCANPDRVVHVGEKLYLCAGSIADLYADEMGGEVHWFGKPMASALEACLPEVGLAPGSLKGEQVMMVGDSLQTDMAGAQAAGYRGMFIAGGIHRDELPTLSAAAMGGSVPVDTFKQIFGAGKAVPHAVMESLVW